MLIYSLKICRCCLCVQTCQDHQQMFWQKLPFDRCIIPYGDKKYIRPHRVRLWKKDYMLSAQVKMNLLWKNAIFLIEDSQTVPDFIICYIPIKQKDWVGIHSHWFRYCRFYHFRDALCPKIFWNADGSGRSLHFPLHSLEDEGNKHDT